MKNCIFMFVALMLHIGLASAQEKISGQVLDSQNSEPIIGATVKSLTGGAITDVDGKFIIEVQNLTENITVSYIGYNTVSKTATELKANPIVELSEDTEALEAVVVTALGIKREEKALGYSSQNVNSEDLDKVRSSNPFTALKGKVAGLEVNTSSNGLASSSRIVIRGENSLNINDNSPLIILDGTPINNDTFGVGGNNTDQANLPTDYGNAALDINPDDIESVNVLKGAAASALYGSRGGNGVIIITTKTGKDNESLGINFSSNTSFSSPLRLPEVQNQFGGGWGLEYYSDYGTNFGPAFDNSLQIAQDGHPGFANGEKIPFVKRYNMKDFFETGSSSTNQLSLAKAFDKGSLRVSYSHSGNKGIVPNTDLKKDNVSINTNYNITDKWTTNISGSYIKSSSDNLPVAGYGNQGIMYTLLWNYNNVDLNWLRDYWVEKDVKQNQLFSWGDNPFFIANENLNGFDKNRLFGNISTSYQVTPKLSVRARIGRDSFDDLRTSRRPWSSVRFTNGMYREQAINFVERNLDGLITYDTDINEDFSLVVSGGANRMDRTSKESLVQGNGLAIPGIYTLGNINVTPTLNRYVGQKRINSVYGFANFGYKDFLFLDVTARNDWSSTLPNGNNSYFYPSASLSFIASDVFDLGNKVDLLKVRANYASVGGDTREQSIRKAYPFGTLPNTVANPSVLPNANLKPVTSTSTEFGLQGDLFSGRLMFDFAAFNTKSKDQIIQADVSEASGYKSIIVNAGEIETNGIELAVSGSPIKKDDFEWRSGVNFSKSKAVVNELYEGLNTYIIANGPNGATVEARPGGRLGDIYGNVFLRSPDGQIIYNKGLPQRTPNRVKIGNYNPDFIMGVTNSLSYKGLTVYGLFNIRQGGYIYSYTNAIGAESGLLSHSVAGHKDGIVGQGVMKDENGNYVPNTVKASAEDWYYGGYYNRANVEANGFDASFVKLKEISIGYDLPTSLISKLRLKRLNVALTGNNVALWTDVPNIDPEAQALNGGTLVPGFEVTQLPSTKSFGFKLNIGL